MGARVFPSDLKQKSNFAALSPFFRYQLNSRPDDEQKAPPRARLLPRLIERGDSLPGDELLELFPCPILPCRASGINRH